MDDSSTVLCSRKIERKTFKQMFLILPYALKINDEPYTKVKPCYIVFIIVHLNMNGDQF